MGGMQQPPQFNWRCVTLNKWCKNKRWLEAWGRGPGDAACFIGQELCTAPGWNGAMHCWDTLQPPNHQASQTLLWRRRQRHSFHSFQKSILLVLRRRCGWTWWSDCSSTKKGHHPHLQLQFLYGGKQIHKCKTLSKHSLLLSLQDLMYVNFRQPTASRQSHFPVIHTWLLSYQENVFSNILSMSIKLLSCFAHAVCVYMCVWAPWIPGFMAWVLIYLYIVLQ